MKILKKSLSYLLIVAMLMGLFGTAVFADSEITGEYIGADDKAYDLISGYYYSAASIATDNCFSNYYIKFYYSDGLFSGDSTEYNEHLATMSLNLAIAGLRSRYSDDLEYMHTVLREMFAEIGCKDESMYFNNDSLTESLEDSIAFGVANKKLCYADGTETGEILVPVSIRGGGYTFEWINNFTIGHSGEASGFAAATDKVYAQLLEYLKEYNLVDDQFNLNENVKLWITGYSRGGAVANLLAKRLVDDFGADAIYAYTSEAPMGGAESEIKTDYNCIFNLINYADIVPRIAPAGMGFIRYGQDVIITPTDDSYDAKKALMDKQLALIAMNGQYNGDDKVYDDNFILAKASQDMGSSGTLINAYLSGKEISLDSFISPITNHTHRGNANVFKGDWIGSLVAQFQAWVVENREMYANDGYTIATNHPGIEDTVGFGIGAYFSMSPSEASGVLDVLGDNLLDCLLDEFPKFSLTTTSILNVPTIITGWENRSAKNKESFLSQLWTVLDNTGIFEESTVLTELKPQIKQAWPTVGDMLLTFVSNDYIYGPESYASDYGYADAKANYNMVFIGTIIENASTLLNEHDFLINLAWVRSADSWYAPDFKGDESDISTDAWKIYSLDAPTGKCNAGLLTDNVSTTQEILPGSEVILDVDTANGEAIFYKIDDLNDATDDNASYSLYQHHIVLDSTKDTEYKISAYANFRGCFSKTIECCVCATNFTGDCHLGRVWMTSQDLKFKINPLLLLKSSKPEIIVSVYSTDKFIKNLHYANIDENSLRCSVRMLEGTDYTYKIFLLDGTNKIPISPSWSSE